MWEDTPEKENATFDVPGIVEERRSPSRHFSPRRGLTREALGEHCGERENGEGEETGRKGRECSEARRSVLSFFTAADLAYLVEHSTYVTISFKVVLAVSLILFTVVPGTLMWYVTRTSVQRHIDDCNNIGQSSVKDITLQLRATMIANATKAVLGYIQPAELAVKLTVARFKGEGYATMDVSAMTNDFQAVADGMDHMFSIFKTTPNMNVFSIGLQTDIQSMMNHEHRNIVQHAMFQRLGIDLLTVQLQQSIYRLEQTINSHQNQTFWTAWCVDQTTGQRIIAIKTVPYDGVKTNDLDVTQEEHMNWFGDLIYHPATNMEYIVLQYLLPVSSGPHRNALIAVQVYYYLYKISTFLASIPHGPKERMFLFFRNERGTMIGASHGKYSSFSDADHSRVIPQLNLVYHNSSINGFTPINASDDTIRAASQWLLATYAGWDSIPELNTVILIHGEDYWITTALIAELTFNAQLVLLVDVQSKLGPIQRKMPLVLQAIAATNTKLTIFLCVVVACAFCLGLIIPIILTRSLVQLERGMVSLALLSYPKSRRSLLMSRSWFSEVLGCHRSFIILERGIKAFDKYVPRMVVQMMLHGQLELACVMFKKTVTIMFMDIAGFSTLSENLPAQLIEGVLCQYLQAMCEVISSCEGTIDKFIGDCVMAMWNAPRNKLQHEVAACDAAIGMQARLLQESPRWEQQGFPTLRFRIGINTAVVLVGNYGCEHRISYTCLGDGVNLANGLEAMNKHFGTVVMTTQVTRDAAKGQHFFRKLGQVVIPGKSKVQCVYELLYRCHQQPQQLDGDVYGVGAQANNTVTKSRQLSRQVTDNLSSVQLASTPDGSVLFHWKLVPYKDLHVLVALYEEGLGQFIGGNFHAAEDTFLRALYVSSIDDKACETLCEQCRRHRGNRVVVTTTNNNDTTANNSITPNAAERQHLMDGSPVAEEAPVASASTATTAASTNTSSSTAHVVVSLVDVRAGGTLPRCDSLPFCTRSLSFSLDALTRVQPTMPLRWDGVLRFDHK